MGNGEGDDTCYLTVFDHGLRGGDNEKLIIMGNIFMEQYYVVYDMSPLEHGADYIQIGLGIQADENLGGAKQYNSASEAFAPVSQIYEVS